MTAKITREQIEEWRKKISAKIFSDFCGEPNEDHGKALTAEFSALCDLALRATEQPARPSEESVRLADGLLKVPSDKNLFARSELVQILAREILRLDALAKVE